MRIVRFGNGNGNGNGNGVLAGTYHVSRITRAGTETETETVGGRGTYHLSRVTYHPTGSGSGRESGSTFVLCTSP
jgi:hypothetical protein